MFEHEGLLALFEYMTSDFWVFVGNFMVLSLVSIFILKLFVIILVVPIKVIINSIVKLRDDKELREINKNKAE